jgi:hypothetical protein
LQSAAASSVAGIFDVTVSTAQRIATFGFSRPIDRGVRNDQHFVIRRHVHNEDVTDAPSRAQSTLARNDRGHQFIRVQTAFHQDLGFAFLDELDCLRGRRVAVRNVDDLEIADVELRCVSRLRDLRRWSNEKRRDQLSRGCLNRARESRRFARVGHRRRNRR